jgi:hypothetical protein
MHGSVRAHQLVAAIPIDLPLRLRSDRRQRQILWDKMQHLIAGLFAFCDRIDNGSNHQRAVIAGLSPAARIEGAAIQDNGMIFIIQHCYAGIEGLQVAVSLIEKLSHKRTFLM